MTLICSRVPVLYWSPGMYTGIRWIQICHTVGSIRRAFIH